ncbi:MAG: hypothetical protein IOC86_05580 [Aestuariivirga sp.]|nr:hypothetical protein [Aestuariivirga sp.]
MTMIYRTAGAWGAGKGSNLTAAEVDGNFHDLDARLVDVETNPAQPVQIEGITSTGSALTITMDNGDVYGPFPIDAATIDFRGNWGPATAYKTNDIVVHAGSEVYYVAADHTSDGTFDANKVVTGKTVYNLMFDVYPIAQEAVGWALSEGNHSGISFNVQPDNTVDATVDFSTSEAHREAITAVYSSLTQGGNTGINFFHVEDSFIMTAAVDAGWVGEASLDWLVDALNRGTHTGISFTYDDNAAVGYGALSANVSVSFTGLTDTPASYGGQGGKLVAVKGDATGIEFIDRNTVTAVAAVPRFMGAMVHMTATSGPWNTSVVGWTAPFDAEIYDTDGFHNTVTNNTRLTIPAGLGIRKVRLSGTGRVNSIAAGSDNFLSIRKNGTDVYVGSGSADFENSANTIWSFSVHTGVLAVSEGDYFELFFKTSDTSVSIDADRTSLSIEVVEVEGGVNIANVQTENTVSRTLGAADINAHLLCTSASAVTITVPANAAVSIPIGIGLDLEQSGAGQVSIVAAGGVTINKPADRTAATRSQFSVLRLRKVGTDSWTLSGDLA